MDDISFPTSDCSSCKRQALLEASLGDDGEIRHRCIHCGAVTAGHEIRWLNEDQINRSGYITEGWRDPHGTRGCRDGACGVQQPDA